MKFTTNNSFEKDIIRALLLFLGIDDCVDNVEYADDKVCFDLLLTMTVQLPEFVRFLRCLQR